MNAQLLAEVQAWIADDPDPKTAAELIKLVADGDEAAFVVAAAAALVTVSVEPPTATEKRLPVVDNVAVIEIPAVSPVVTVEAEAEVATPRL